MHIPDGFLDVKTAVATYTISAAVIPYAMGQAKKTMRDKNIPFMASMASFVFVAQMINFPIAGGTSGHLLGNVLLSYLFGPWVSTIIMSVVITLQALLFGDGGITALGANIFNMAVVANLAGYLIMKLFGKLKISRNVSLFAASWFSVMLAALFASAEIALSGLISFKVAAVSMLFWHGFIGIGEGALSAFITSAILKARPKDKGAAR